MALVVGTNTSALYSQNAMKANARSTATTMERLSTGVRVNSAKDDAAGLAIGQNMTSYIRGLNQAVRNINDGINLVQTADGALSSISTMLQRMRELAVQSANGTNSDVQRAYLQKESTALQEQIAKVVDTTMWNDQKLLDGTFSKPIQTGSDVGTKMDIVIPSTVLNPTITTTYSATTHGLNIGSIPLAAGNVSINGVSIGSASGASAKEIATAINLASGDTGVTATANATKSAPTQITGNGTGYSNWAGSEPTNSIFGESFSGENFAILDPTGWFDIQGDGENRVFSYLVEYGGISGSSSMPPVLANPFTETSSGITNDSTNGHSYELITTSRPLTWDEAKAAAEARSNQGQRGYLATVTSAQENTFITSNFGPSLTWMGASDAAQEGVWKWVTGPEAGTTFQVGNFGEVTPGNIANNGIKINGVNIGPIAVASSDSVRATQLLSAVNSHSADTGVVASLDAATGGINLTAADGRNIVVSTDPSVSSQSIGIALTGPTVGNRTITTFSSAVDLTSISSSGINITSTNDGAAATGLASRVVPPTVTTTATGNSIEINTIVSASSAISKIDTALDSVNSTRATLGSYLNTLAYAADNVTNVSSNSTQSRSTILDADYAIETTNLAKNQIIQQAATAMLAQANTQPQAVMALLKNM